MINRITPDQLNQCVKVIQESFGTVAKEFRLTTANCPTHPSFIQLKHLVQMQEKDVQIFGYFENDMLVGVVAIEQVQAIKTTWYIEKVSVLPQYRHLGIGHKLIEFAISEIKQRGGSYISISLIDEQIILKNWYLNQGFNIYLTKTYQHLPFTVCFMEYKLFQLEKTLGESAELQQLITSLDDDLRERYGDSEIHGIDLQKADKNGIIFYIGRYGKEAVCCGALRSVSKNKAEIKRMFVRKEYRRKGFSKLLYSKLEEQAKAQGYTVLILETGKKQFEAHSLYKHQGFIPIEKFGEYVNDPNSLCFAKEI